MWFKWLVNLRYPSLHQIRNWFQNRRMKLKRTVQDSLAHACQAKVASHMMHYSDLHSFRAAPYPSFYPGVQESPAPYGSGFHYGPATAGSLPSLPVEALYQYSTLQSLPVHPSNPSMMTPYPPYHPHYYSTQWEERPPTQLHFCLVVKALRLRLCLHLYICEYRVKCNN